jgi:hypothetical protein
LFLRTTGCELMFPCAALTQASLSASRRSAVNNDVGAKTPVAQFVCGLLVMFVLLFLTPVFKLMPYNCLAAVIIIGVATLVDLTTPVHFFKVRWPVCLRQTLHRLCLCTSLYYVKHARVVLLLCPLSTCLGPLSACFTLTQSMLLLPRLCHACLKSSHQQHRDKQPLNTTPSSRRSTRRTSSSGWPPSSAPCLPASRSASPSPSASLSCS